MNRYLAALSRVMTVAVKELGWIEGNPVRRVERLAEPRGRVRFLSEDELERLLSACRCHRNRLPRSSSYCPMAVLKTRGPSPRDAGLV